MSRLRRPKKTTNTSGVEFDCFSRPSCFFFPLHTRRVESAHGTYTCRWCRWSGNIVECRRLTEECHAKTTLADERKHTSQSVSRGSERIKKNDRVSCACLQLVRLPSVAIPLIFKLASCVFASCFFCSNFFHLFHRLQQSGSHLVCFAHFYVTDDLDSRSHSCVVLQPRCAWS